MTFKGSDVSPSSATTLERVLADLAWARISPLDVDVVRHVVDPATCPVALLPWLAWAMSVDTWDQAWPEATKRAVIAASPEVHRVKGTRRAVRLGLEALGVETDILEWFDDTPPARRGTFKVTAWATDGSGPILDLTLFTQMRQSIARAKPKSRVFTLRIGARPPGTLYAGGAQQNIARLTVSPEP